MFLKFRNFWTPERDGFDVNRRRAKPRPSRPEGLTEKQPASF
jgi:hypothetical protein